MTTSNSSFQITIRSRPLLEDLEDEEAWSIDPHNKTISSIYRSPTQFLQDPSSKENINYIKRRYADVNYNYIFKFDHVFDCNNTTEELYKERCRDIVYSFMNGISGTIFTYGQTMSGKTFTMLGAINNPGILPFALLDIFEDADKKRKENWQVKATLSYFEIYNETLKDLLNPNSNNLKILDDPKNGVKIQGLKFCEASTFEEAIMVLKIGEEERNYAQTSFHDRSSRSHTVFQVKMEQYQSKDKSMTSIINLIDLAGSERVGEDDTKHNQSEETGFINKSLFVLSNVIHRLAEGKKAHIPYRDSKLTRILAHSLGGLTPTAIICTVSPANMNFYQTLSTLRFADRAKSVQRNILFSVEKKNANITNKSFDKINENNLNYEEIIETLKKKIETKDKEIKSLKEKSQKFNPNEKNKFSNSSFNLSEEFLLNLKSFNLTPNQKISDFFEEMDQTTKKIIINPQEKQENIRNWCLRFQGLFTEYKKTQEILFETFKKLPYEKKTDLGEDLIEIIENETIFNKPNDLQIQMTSPLELKKKLDEDYERYWNILDLHFKQLIQNPTKEFINLLEITENHKKSLQKLDSLYEKSLEEIEKKMVKEKTPKFYTELTKIPSFNFNPKKNNLY